MNDLKEEIKKKAFEIGFSKIGFARVEALNAEQINFQKWLDNGFNGTMGWMGRNKDKRSDPRNILPSSKSVISVALNYYSDYQHSEELNVGKISRYAWGDDYHEILNIKLKELLEFIKLIEPSTEGKIYYDTGPIMEKVWAARSGIGWQGKHTVMITKEYGSWVFLGEILSNLEFDYDSPVPDLCGNCRLCIDACPTKAILDSYVLNASHCIAYLTIEHTGPIPNELADHLNGWIFGCDICQDVCPWNRKYPKQSAMKEFLPYDNNVSAKLNELTEMTKEEFDLNFKNSPIKRRKLYGFKQNIKRVLQNQISK
jgi:epoxyqueuosine reductase